MEFIGDFHIHGPYAQACSRNTTLENLESNAKIKGINILSTGDCLHPKWNDTINKKLTEDKNGILWSKNKFPFIWQTEICLMYTKNGKGRRIHYIILFPNKDVVQQATDALLKKGRLDYDGRPIFGIDSIELLEMMRSISADIEIIPAHAWTSWMSIFGSKSGFNSVEECFEEKSKHIHAIETGLSSNPLMNRRVSKLDKYNLVSFSDAHSYHIHRIGREATIFDLKELTYKNILNAIRTGKGLSGTIEIDPKIGKYHEDGHRSCDLHVNFKESKKLNKICPKCRKELTIGVEYRVEELADREKPINVPEFKTLIPLTELISSIYGIKQLQSKKILEIYNKLISNFKNEYNILIKTKEDDLRKIVHEKLSNLIIKNREGKLNITPGYDGIYGKIILEEKDRIKEQKTLTNY